MFTTSLIFWTVRGSNGTRLRSTTADSLPLPLPPTGTGSATDHPGERENDVAVIDTGLMLAQAEARSF